MSSAVSSAGKKIITALIGLMVVDAVVIALATRVNQFQEYFFMADLFPLALSIATMVFLALLLLLNVAVINSFLVRPPFQIGCLFVFSILWLAFNVFSTSRWRHVPRTCDVIPLDYAAERTWCKDLHALMSVVWLEFVFFTTTTVFILRYILSQQTQGRSHIWNSPLARYDPRVATTENSRTSEFLQYEKF